ncbi:MAG: shikimate dehydrogenase [Actinomycetota bacterium]
MISGRTRLAAVIGDPVRHSLSPAIHNAAFAARKLDWVYLALPVATGNGAEAVAAMRTLGIDGLSVTMPHKAAVAAAADARTPAVETLGVANCLFVEDNRIVADSTDGDGFVSSFTTDFGTTLADLRCVVVGAGGAARSIIEAVGRAGAAEITVVNRSADRAVAAAVLAPQAVAGSADDPAVFAEADVLINATAVGMAGGPDPDGSPVPTETLRSGQRVVDIVYQPRRTPLLVAAEAVGAEVADGVGMLVHQAALAFERWTGQAAPLDVMTRAVVDRA